MANFSGFTHKIMVIFHGYVSLPEGSYGSYKRTNWRPTERYRKWGPHIVVMILDHGDNSLNRNL